MQRWVDEDNNNKKPNPPDQKPPDPNNTDQNKLTSETPIPEPASPLKNLGNSVGSAFSWLSGKTVQSTDNENEDKVQS